MKTSSFPLFSLSYICLFLCLSQRHWWKVVVCAFFPTYCSLSYIWLTAVQSTGLVHTQTSHKKPNEHSQKQPTYYLTAFWLCKVANTGDSMVVNEFVENTQKELFLDYFYRLWKKSKLILYIFVFEFCPFKLDTCCEDRGCCMSPACKALWDKHVIFGSINKLYLSRRDYKGKDCVCDCVCVLYTVCLCVCVYVQVYKQWKRPWKPGTLSTV